MSAARDIRKPNVVIGSGEFFIDLLDDKGALTGERYVGDSPGGTLATAAERIQVFSGDGPIASPLVNKVRSVTHTIAITLRDMSMENLALLFGAAEAPADAAAVAATAVTDEEHTVIQGRWYQLGRTDANPRGVGAVSATGIVVTDNAAVATSYDADDDYVVDTDRGRLYIVPGGAIAASGAETIEVDYTPVAAAAGATQRLSVAGLKDVRGAVRYLEDTETGKGRDFYARLCSISAAGETQLKSRDQEQQIAIACEVEDPGGGIPMLVIDGQPA